MEQSEIISKVVEINCYKELNPVQKEAMKYLGKNTIICTPTASGKTTIFEIYMLDCLLNRKKKVVYISPLKALTHEHYSETKKKFAKEFDAKIGISTGDLDASAKYLHDYDVLFLTFEKFDSVVRHDPSWLSKVGLLTIDEIHELGGNRGATLEAVITQIKNSFKDLIILGLSATIGNSEELAGWLNAELVKMDYRPVPLAVGVCYDNSIYFDGRQINLKEKEEHSEDQFENIIIDTLENKKQIIVFCNSRKSASSMATKYSSIVGKIVIDKKLKMIAETAGNALEQPTKQCLTLYNCLLNGVAFHHAGLVHKQREIIEDYFRAGNLKVIFATPTLAAGINLPAFRVVINSIYRYEATGMTPISINEFHQMAGRAGRPKYDVCGEAIVITTKENEVQKIYNSYITAKPTNIYSQLSKINLLRMHLLSVIIVNDINDFEGVMKHLSQTFYSYSFGDSAEMERNIKEIISEFADYGFVKNDDKIFKITELGKKVCYLYVDPQSANNILQDLKIKEEQSKEIEDIDLLYTLLNTSELSPYLGYRQSEEDSVFQIFEQIKQRIFFDYEDLNLLKKIYEAMILREWINEVNENTLLEKYNITPGQIQEIVNRLEWICHCVVELAKTESCSKEIIKKYQQLKERIKYGIKEELLQLVQLKNIGRIRARRLFSTGIKTIDDAKKQPDKLISIVGKIGQETLAEIGIKQDVLKEDSGQEDKQKTQRKIFDF